MDFFINKFYINIFDKREALPFFVVRMFRLTGNIPSKIFYAVYGEKVLRIARVSGIKTDFINHS